MRWRRVSLAIALVVGLSFGPMDQVLAAVTLESDSDIAAAGYFRLHWEASETPI